MDQVYNHNWFQKYTSEDPSKAQVPTPNEIQSEFMTRRVAVDVEHERLLQEE